MEQRELADCSGRLCHRRPLGRQHAQNPGYHIQHFQQRPAEPYVVVKTISLSGMYHSSYLAGSTIPRHHAELSSRGFEGFLNDFHDDEGWWALALIRSWDVAHSQVYLDEAKSIFEDMRNGTDSTCGGGIWWSKERAYKNAIANELYLSVAASPCQPGQE